MAGKPFLPFLERRRFPGSCKCFPGRLLRLLCHSSPPLCPAAVLGAPRQLQGRVNPGFLLLCSPAPWGGDGVGLAAQVWSHLRTPRLGQWQWWGWVPRGQELLFSAPFWVAARPPEAPWLASEPGLPAGAAASLAGRLSHCRACPAPPTPLCPFCSFGERSTFCILDVSPGFVWGDRAESFTRVARGRGRGQQSATSTCQNDPGALVWCQGAKWGEGR